LPSGPSNIHKKAKRHGVSRTWIEQLERKVGEVHAFFSKRARRVVARVARFCLVIPVLSLSLNGCTGTGSNSAANSSGNSAGNAANGGSSNVAGKPLGQKWQIEIGRVAHAEHQRAAAGPATLHQLHQSPATRAKLAELSGCRAFMSTSSALAR
jgi:hypothetical protein